ncbi:hypothetical protein [Methanoculleus sp. 7T]|uniref:hypothetical protein n=1 Tax=Methanoculleus sp. 7T TaxID=2937282 RepID=UPI0020BF7715|nr:hypothetical protein [Methanoculleus sp. 7T]MCK8519471.1 hypothetical protein [Methanoculleus sp. 7T]
MRGETAYPPSGVVNPFLPAAKTASAVSSLPVAAVDSGIPARTIAADLLLREDVRGEAHA